MRNTHPVDPDFVKRVDYLYTLESDYQYNTDRFSSKLHGISFKNEYLEIICNGPGDVDINVFTNYAWDGCTPKFKAFGVVFGVSDGPINPETGKPQAYYASMLHDVLYDYSREIAKENGCRISDILYVADDIFYDILRRDGFRRARLYYWAVRRFGHWRVKIRRRGFN